MLQAIHWKFSILYSQYQWESDGHWKLCVQTFGVTEISMHIVLAMMMMMMRLTKQPINTGFMGTRQKHLNGNGELSLLFIRNHWLSL